MRRTGGVRLSIDNNKYVCKLESRFCLNFNLEAIYLLKHDNKVVNLHNRLISISHINSVIDIYVSLVIDVQLFNSELGSTSNLRKQEASLWLSTQVLLKQWLRLLPRG